MFFTSDLHIGHKNIIRYCDRPFDSVEEMNEKIIENWNSVVRKNDMIFVLGDFAITGSQNAQEAFNRLHGRKILIRGNHDHKPSKMWRMGWEQVYDIHAMTINEELVTMSHYPHFEDNEWLREHPSAGFQHPHNNGGFLLNGHIHSSPENKIRGKQFDVGVDANNFTPVPIEEIRQWINNTKRDEKIVSDLPGILAEVF